MNIYNLVHNKAENKTKTETSQWDIIKEQKNRFGHFRKLTYI